MTALSQILSLPGAEISKISVRFRVSGEQGWLRCSQALSGSNGP